jgi:cysteine desulfurase / selenocysteine lyase
MRNPTADLAFAARAHFNCAGASLPDPAVLHAITEHFKLELELGPMEAAAAIEPKLAIGRENIARLIGANASEIAFASSGSMAHGLAFAALPPLRAGERILVGRQEWGGNLASYQQAALRAGATVEAIACNRDGSVDVPALARMLDARVRLVSLTWLPANGGLINDAVAIGRITRAAGVPYFIDAGQALGQVPVDVENLQCDVLKSAGRKHLRGPRGTAILYVRQNFLAQTQPAFVSTLAAPEIDGDLSQHLKLRNDARRFECAELSSALTLGLCVAVQQTLQLDLPMQFKRLQARAETLRNQLADIAGVTLCDLGSMGNRSGLVSFNLKNMDALAVKAYLAEQNLTLAANGILYTPLDMRARGIERVVRASLSPLNTDDEIARLVAVIAGLSRR